MATSTEEGQQHPLSIYIWIWVLLFVFSTASYFVDYFQFQGLPQMEPDSDFHDAEGRFHRGNFHAHGLGTAGTDHCHTSTSSCLAGTSGHDVH